MLWYAINYVLGCMSFGDNYENYVCELGGLDISYIMIIVVMTSLLKYWCNHSFKLGDLNYMKIKLYGYKARSILWISGRFNVIIEEEYVCIIKLTWNDLSTYQ